MKNKLLENLGLKIMAVLFAVCLWLVVVNVSDPIDSQTFRNVNVTVQHDDEIVKNKGKTYQVLNNTQVVAVTVKAKRSELSKIKQSDIVATADMRDIELASMIPINVTISGFEGKYEEAYTTPINMQVNIEAEANNIFPITAATTGTLRDGYVLNEMNSNPGKVQISGPDSLVNRINRVVAKVDISGLSSDKTLPGELVMYDAEDNLIDQTLLTNNLGEAGVSVDITLLKSKSVGLTFNVSGDPAEGYVYANMKYEPTDIQVTGSTELLDGLDNIEVPASALDISNLTHKTEMVVDISRFLPEGVMLADKNANSVVVTVFIERIGTKVIDLAVRSILIKNTPADLKSKYGKIDDITLEFEGSAEALNSLTTDKVEASIDLKNYKDSGTFDVPVLIEAPNCSVVKAVTVNVILEKK
ncbi:MAG: CdaR family protein [Lachnospiraceae bacterium]